MAYGTINADQITPSVAGSSIGAGNASLMKNRIINGAMVIDQRNAGASVTPTSSGFSVDRWQLSITQASKLSMQQNAGSVTPPVGFTNYLGTTSLSAYSVVAGDYFSWQQIIEGYNIADLAWGTANAKTVTLSFQVYSSLTGTFGGALRNSPTTQSYPFTYSIPVANTWTTISITITGPTSGTWLTTNGIGIILNFGLGVGSTYSGTAGSWSAGNYVSATGATSVVGTNGATFYITGVQLEVGSSATGFEYRHYATELNMCQRYYEKSSDYSIVPYSAGTAGMWIAVNINTTDFYDYGRCQFRVTKRAIPSVSLWSPLNGAGLQWYNISQGSNIGNSGVRYSGMNGCGFYSTNNAMSPALSATGTHWFADAEL